MRAAAEDEFQFDVLERSEPRGEVESELALRVGGASSPEDALAKALQVYADRRQEARLAPHKDPRASVGVWPASD